MNPGRTRFPLMSQLLGIVHGREETFPPALLTEINAREAGVHGESLIVSSVEALERTPYRLLVDRLSGKVGYFRSLLEQQRWLGAECTPSLALLQLDRVGLAQMALIARVPCPPTLLLPHHSHPPGVEADDLGNLAFPMPWEKYLQQVGLPASLRSLQLGPGPVRQISSLSQLWQVYGKSGHDLMVIQPDHAGAEHLLVVIAGQHLEVLGYDPITGRYHPPNPELVEPARQATARLQSQLDLNLTGVEFAWLRSKLWLSDLHRVPDLEWWNLGEDAFQRIIQHCATELIRRIVTPASPPTKTGKAKKMRTE